MVGVLPIDRPISDYDEPIDDLLNLLPKCEEKPPYAPSIWGPEAYKIGRAHV